MLMSFITFFLLVLIITFINRKKIKSFLTNIKIKRMYNKNYLQSVIDIPGGIEIAFFWSMLNRSMAVSMFWWLITSMTIYSIWGYYTQNHFPSLANFPEPETISEYLRAGGIMFTENFINTPWEMLSQSERVISNIINSGLSSEIITSNLRAILSVVDQRATHLDQILMTLNYALENLRQQGVTSNLISFNYLEFLQDYPRGAFDLNSYFLSENNTITLQRAINNLERDIEVLHMLYDHIINAIENL